MLNNHGWGIRDMIIYSCIILLFLLIATYYIKSFYSGLSNASNTVVETKQEEKVEKEINYSLYKNYEQRMSNAAINYVYNHYNGLNNGIASVRLTELISGGYIEPLYDQKDGTGCVGYSNVWDTEDGVLHASSYISCTSYKTEGFIN
jgi:hypothetical protein